MNSNDCGVASLDLSVVFVRVYSHTFSPSLDHRLRRPVDGVLLFSFFPTPSHFYTNGA